MKTITEVVAALIWDGDKFMICQRPAHKARGLLWEFVGGKVESGETKEQALIRECIEELAVTLAVDLPCGFVPGWARILCGSLLVVILVCPVRHWPDGCVSR